MIFQCVTRDFVTNALSPNIAFLRDVLSSDRKSSRIPDSITTLISCPLPGKLTPVRIIPPEKLKKKKLITSTLPYSLKNSRFLVLVSIICAWQSATLHNAENILE